jgi:hypothetical protein
LTQFQSQLYTHIQVYGQFPSPAEPPFTVTDVFDHLVCVNAPDVPATLRPLIPPTGHAESITTATPSTPLIASFDTDQSDLIVDPTINALRRKERCPACLMGFHDPDDCLHRGPNFRDPAFNRRMNVYNKQFGDKPPPNHKIREWKPQSPSPVHPKDQSSRPEKQSQDTPNTISGRMLSNLKNGSTRRPPFHNADTKANVPSKPNINLFEQQSNPLYCQEATFDDVIDELGNVDFSSDPVDPQNTQPTMNALRVSTQENVYGPSTDDESYPVICSAHTPLQSSPRLRRDPPSAPFNFTDNRHQITSSTPLTIRTTIDQAHALSSVPSKRFLTSHSRDIAALPSTSFSSHCHLTLQVDGGANCGALTSKDCFYFYVPSKVEVQQVNGSTFTSPGWGGILVRLNGFVRLLAPFHYCPGNPRNAFSPSSLKEYCGFTQAIVSTNESIHLVDISQHRMSTSLTTYNDLDFIDLEIMQFTSPPHQTINSCSSLSKRPSSTCHDLPRLPKRALTIIASFYVHLFHPDSPRETAIRTMNTVLGNRFRNLDSPSRRLAPPSTLPGYGRQSNDRVIVPVMNKLSRASRYNYTPMQKYMQLHVSFMHASDSTITPILQKQLLRDLPKDLHKKINSLSCSCTICALRKSDKLSRGRLVDHTLMPPFQLLHLDFSFFGAKSLRGFTSALDVTCASTSYPLGFPMKAKTLPLETVRWLISTLRSMGFEVTFIRVDEDSSLAKSAEFCSLIMNMNCLLQTTGGGNSTNNS